MMQVHQAFTEELSQVPADSVSAFLLHYACCDALTHIAWAAVEGRTPQAGLDWDFDNRLRGKGGHPLTAGDITRALQKLEPSLGDDVIKRVFEGGKLSFASGSAKFLRNRIMHEVRLEAIEQVQLRGRRLFADMQNVIGVLKAKAADPAGISVPSHA
jgi:hypothetical protein